jgi:hypothetical protein
MSPKKWIVPFISLLLLTSLVLPAAAQSKVRVKVESADIYSAPDVASTRLYRASRGTLFTFVDKVDRWYIVLLPADQKQIPGYIQDSLVEEISEEAVPVEKAKEVKEPVPDSGLVRPSIERPGRKFKKFFVYLDFQLGFTKDTQDLSYTQTIYYEPAEYGLAYTIDKGNSFDGGAGFMFSPLLGVRIGGSYTSRTVHEKTTLSIPHPLWMESPRTGEITGDSLQMTTIDLYLNLVCSLRFGMFGLDLYVGPGYALTQATLVSQVTFSETGYPYGGGSASQSNEKINRNIFGVNGGISLGAYLGDFLAIVLDGRYISGSAAYKPAGDIPQLTATTGGLRAGGGIKLLF